MQFNLHTIIQHVRSFWSWKHLNPFNWSKTEVKMFLVSFLSIMLPIYLFIGLQPAPIANAESLPQLEIPSISLKTPVATIELVDRQLTAPSTIAGVYHSAPNKTFIIGHSSTVFKHLDQVQTNDTFTYDGKLYTISHIETLLKSDINMSDILRAASEDTIIIMTCAGQSLPHQDATHRLIVTAIAK